jgi:hypothetical protein
MLVGKKSQQPPAQPENPSATAAGPSEETHFAESVPVPESPLAKARCGGAGVALFDRGAPGIHQRPQPWLATLVGGALSASANHELRLALVWPGTIQSVSLLSCLATLERFAIGDKRGLRTLLFPTKRQSYSALNQWLLERDGLLEITRRFLTVTLSPSSKPPLEGRENQDKDMLLMAVNSARIHEPGIAPPSIAEIQPHFDWDLGTGGWGHYGNHFLQRTKRALRAGHRKALWEPEDGRIARLGAPLTAPDALFGISHRATAKDWKAALASKEFKGSGQPDLVLFDLTKEIRRTTDRNLIRVVPEVIAAVREKWTSPVGFLLVTDDPRTYFTLRKTFSEQGDKFLKVVVCQPIVSVEEDYGVSASPHPAGWVPPTVSNRLFPVGVLDHELADAASRFWTLSQDFDETTAPFQALRAVASFLMRFANLPGGYRDYINWMEASSFADSIRSDMTWNGHEARLTGMLDRGEFEDVAQSVRRAVTRASKFFETYYEATPIAKRIAKELDFEKLKPNDRIAVVLRYNADMAVAKAFLANYSGFSDGKAFSSIADRVDLINHKEVPRFLTSESAPAKFIFVGLPDETLKELLTSEALPARSVVLFDWQRANNVFIGLQALKTVDVYKPYRGRISLLASEIERCLKALPKAIDIERLSRVRVPRLSLLAAASEASRRADGPPTAYKLVLEDFGRLAVGHRVYVYDPNEKEPFQPKSIENVQPGDLVFVMSDELHDLFEAFLIEAGNPITRGSRFADLLRNYHRDVLTNSKRLFGDLPLAALARQVKERMKEIRPDVDCSISRLRYWLDLKGSSESQAEDLKPQSTWKKADFETFARALEIPESLIGLYWDTVADQRTAHQQAGRELADRYAQVLFTEETAELHYKLKRDAILRLQHEAIRNTYRVEQVIAPLITENAHGNT